MPAECLVKLERAGVESDPLQWGRGHIVDVKFGGHKWGVKEGLPKFAVVVISDATPEQVVEFLESAVDVTGPKPIVKALRKRVLNIDAAEIPAAVRNAILTTGRVTVTKAQVLSFLKEVLISG